MEGLRRTLLVPACWLFLAGPLTLFAQQFAGPGPSIGPRGQTQRYEIIETLYSEMHKPHDSAVATPVEPPVGPREQGLRLGVRESLLEEMRKPRLLPKTPEFTSVAAPPQPEPQLIPGQLPGPAPIIEPSVGPRARARVYGTVEYLNWWSKKGDTPPLVTRNPNPGAIGSLFEPGTSVIFGGPQALDYRTTAGIRASIGLYPTEERIGFEVGGFLMQREAIRFLASSAGGGAPVISVPVNSTVPFGTNPAGETSLNSGGAPNQIYVSTHSQLWGTDARAAIPLINRDRVGLFGLLGVKYLQLREDVGLRDTFIDNVRNGTVVLRDQFDTDNVFVGGDLGLAARFNWRGVTLDLASEIVLGANFQHSSVAGSTTVTANAFGLPNGANQAGIFALPSNSGSFHRDVFAFAPSAQIKLGYEFTRFLDAWVGYEFLYISNVIRAGSQIERTVNPTQNNVLQPQVGTATPRHSFTSTDYYAHGFNVGVRIRY